MPSFGTTSLSRLARVHPDLVTVAKRVVNSYDCSILEGWRSHDLQDLYFSQGKSTVRAGESWHNGWVWDDGKWVANPEGMSLAVDIAPYPINWDDLPRFRVFAHFLIGVGYGLGINIRWGGDWNKDWKMKNQQFHDLPHFELFNPGPVASLQEA